MKTATKTQYAFTLSDALVAAWIILTLLGLVGWCLNAYKLASICCAVDGWLALRTLGIFLPPLGAVIGFV